MWGIICLLCQRNNVINHVDTNTLHCPPAAGERAPPASHRICRKSLNNEQVGKTRQKTPLFLQFLQYMLLTGTVHMGFPKTAEHLDIEHFVLHLVPG